MSEQTEEIVGIRANDALLALLKKHKVRSFKGDMTWGHVEVEFDPRAFDEPRPITERKPEKHDPHFDPDDEAEEG